MLRLLLAALLAAMYTAPIYGIDLCSPAVLEGGAYLACSTWLGAGKTFND